MENDFLPAPPEVAVRLRQLALALMDAAERYEEGQEEEGAQAALKVAEQVSQFLAPLSD